MSQFDHAESVALPFDERTLAIGIVSRWRLMLFLTVSSLAIAVVAALVLGTRSYTAETTVLHVEIRDDEGEAGGGAGISLSTWLNLVKLPRHLERTRERLDLAATLEGLGSSIEAFVRRDTGLLVIRATWDDPNDAAAIANTVRETFLEASYEVLFHRELEGLQTRSKRLDDRFGILESKLSRLNEVELGLRTKMIEEKRASPELEGLGDLNIRIERLRDAIFDDKDRRAKTAVLDQLYTELATLITLQEKGLASAIDIERLQAKIGRQEAITLETERTTTWRAELEHLQNIAIPESTAATSPSAAVLQDLLLSELKLRLERVALDEERHWIDGRRALVHASLEVLEQGGLRSALTTLPDGIELRVVSVAVAPITPSKSTRRLIAIAVAALLGGLGLIIVATFELIDTRPRSSADFSRRTGIEPITEIARHDLPGNINLTLAAARLERILLRPRLLIASPDEQLSGVITTAIAEALQARGRSIAVLDARGSEAISRFPLAVAKSNLIELGDELSLAELAGRQLEPLLDAAATTADWSLVAAPADKEAAEMLVGSIGAVLLPIPAGRVPAATVRRLVDRIRVSGAQSVHVILTDVEHPYLNGAN